MKQRLFLNNARQEGEIMKFDIKTALGFILILLAIGTVIDLRIDSKINNPDYIARVASEINKVAIITDEQVVVSDKGAMELIKDYNINEDKIVIETKEYLDKPPFVTCLNDTAVYKAERGEKFKWIFTPMDSQSFLLLESSPKIINYYRIEFF